MIVFMVLLLVMSVLISWCSDSFFGMWAGLELLNFGVYPCIVFSDKSEYVYSGLFKYFLLQALSSIMLFLSLIVLWDLFGMNLGILLCIMALYLKFGGVFLGMFLSFAEGMSWMSLLLILGLQKLPVLAMLIHVGMWMGAVLMVISGLILSSISVVVFCFCTIRGIVLCSSVLNSGWIWVGLAVNPTSGINYLIVYIIHFSCFCLLMDSEDSKESSRMSLSSNMSILELITLFSLAGLPPFSVFFAKVQTLFQVISAKFVLESSVLTILSTIMMFMYVNLVISILLLGGTYKMEKKSCAFGLVLLVIIFSEMSIYLCFLC